MSPGADQQRTGAVAPPPLLLQALGALACCSCHTVLAGVQDVLPIGPQGATGSIFVNAHGFVSGWRLN
jgi:hypothetical protein